MRDFGIWPQYSEACRQDIDDLLKRGGSLSAYRANKDYGSGPANGSWAERLEREIEKNFKVKHAVAVNSGTAALHAGLVGAGITSGQVVTSPYTFSATASAILLAGCEPVFADVDPHTFCITKETVKRVLGNRTRAILPVHLFGGMADVPGIKSLDMPVIEDACQAVGASRDGVYAGACGQAGIYSFNGGKNVPAGEAGALVTNSSKIAEKARLLMNHGENFGSNQVGYNYRPNELTCCVAWHGMRELDGRNEQRKQLMLALAKKLATYREVPLDYWWPDDGSHVYYVLAFALAWFSKVNRAKFIQRLQRKGIPASGGYITPPLHHYKAFRKYAKRELPVVDELSFKTLCLLSHIRPPATQADMEYTAKCMEEALR